MLEANTVPVVRETGKADSSEDETQSGEAEIHLFSYLILTSVAKQLISRG